jgi:hypothetical protein
VRGKDSVSTTFDVILLVRPATGSPDSNRKKLRVFISADTEGVAGVVNGAQLPPGEFEYEKFRRLMTAEVNACMEGAFAAGAPHVTVADSHGNGLSLWMVRRFVLQVRICQRLCVLSSLSASIVQPIDGNMSSP